MASVLLLSMTGAYVITHSVPAEASNVTHRQRMPADRVSGWTPGTPFCRRRFLFLASQTQHTLEEVYELFGNGTRQKCVGTGAQIDGELTQMRYGQINPDNGAQQKVGSTVTAGIDNRV